jgi:hypothetical protein
MTQMAEYWTYKSQDIPMLLEGKKTRKFETSQLQFARSIREVALFLFEKLQFHFSFWTSQLHSMFHM